MSDNEPDIYIGTDDGEPTGEQLDIDGAGSGGNVDGEHINPSAVNNIRYVEHYGDPTSDIGDSIQQAHDDLPAGGGGLVLPMDRDAYPLNSTALLTKKVRLSGVSKRAPRLLVESDVDAIEVDSDLSILENFQIAGNLTDWSGNGLVLTNFDRGAVKSVSVRAMGNDGIVWTEGNLVTFFDVLTKNNDRHGFTATTETENNNAGFFYGMNSHSNTGHGFHFPSAGDGSNFNSRQHFLSINANNNGESGVNIDTRNSIGFLYLERNNGDQLSLGPDSAGNFLMFQTSEETGRTITDDGISNFLFESPTGGGKERRWNNWWTKQIEVTGSVSTDPAAPTDYWYPSSTHGGYPIEATGASITADNTAQDVHNTSDVDMGLFVVTGNDTASPGNRWSDIVNFVDDHDASQVSGLSRGTSTRSYSVSSRALQVAIDGGGETHDVRAWFMGGTVL